MNKILKKPYILPLILIIAVAIVVLRVKTKAPIEHENSGFSVKAVEVITAKILPFRARATAFGHIEPSVLLKSKSEVSGKIIYVHPDLKQGASLASGTVVLRIEPTTFKISLNQSEAGLAGSQSSLVQLETEEESTRQSLIIAKQNLSVELDELTRIKSLWEKRLIARSTLDKEEQKVLTLRQQAQDIEGKLSSYASRKSAINAQIKQSESQVDRSQDTLGRTEIRLPFDARIGEVYIEEGEFTTAGATLFEALGVQAVEITAQLPVKQFRPLVAQLSSSENNSINLQNPQSLQTAIAKMQLEAQVRLVGDTNHANFWEGKLIRLSESVDPSRDTLGLVVAIDNPYQGIIPGKRPPLLKGMYTSIDFYTPARPNMVIPRKAIHQGRVYTISKDNTLNIRPVSVLFNQGDLVIISADENGGIKEGEQIIISDVIPVMQGMPLKPIINKTYQDQLAKKSLGKQ